MGGAKLTGNIGVKAVNLIIPEEVRHGHLNF